MAIKMEHVLIWLTMWQSFSVMDLFAGSMHGNFYRAMVCIRGTSHGPVSVRPSVCLSVCPSQVSVLLKRLNVGSHKQQRMIAQGL